MKALLAEAYDRNTLGLLPGPYHMLATFQTFGLDGQPTGDGSIEIYRAGRGRQKTVTHFHDHSMTQYVADGKMGYTDDGFEGSIMTYFVSEFLLDSMFPPPATANREIEVKTMALQGSTMDCGLFQFEISQPPFSMPPKDTFCVSRDTHDLALKQTAHFSVRYRDFSDFLGKSIPRTITASKGSQTRCKIKIEQLDQAEIDAASFTLPSDASTVSPAPNIYATQPGEATPVHSTKPAVDPALKASHATGSVLLYFLISRTGTVIDAEPLVAPSPELAQAGIDVVKGWTLKPIIRNGKAIEVISHAAFTLKF